RICALSVIPCLLLGIALIRRPATISATYSQSDVNEQLDQRLARAAASALQNQEGTIIVIDPQTGRVITVVNSTMAFENAFAPGSTLKPFAALAAMRSGLIKSTARTQCHAKYTHKDFQMACSHPQPLPPLNPSEALAYSCNYYFGKLGERINERKFDELLSSFGFGKKTGINADRESEGKLATNGWEPEDVLGNSDYVQVTPIQLLLAYSAFLNGGNLFTPRTAPAKNFN